jgi:[ribosomal protein S5]-alanine N-acetyltransferase
VTVLTTERLYLAPLAHALMRERLSSDTFSFDVAEIGTVSFDPSWPGDALAMFHSLVGNSADPVANSYVAIERDTLRAVGQLGATGEVLPNGEIEIGYGFGVTGQGFATEAVEALVTNLLSSGSIVAITANTAVDNVASHRVLTKNGFRQAGTSSNEEDGDLLVWRRD